MLGNMKEEVGKNIENEELKNDQIENDEIENDEIEDINENNNKIIKNEITNKVKDKKVFTIFGYSIWRLMAYFIIYSFIGYIIETIFGMITKGVWESRQSFLYGPFCGVYGLGAVVMIVFLQYFNKNNNRLFLGGFIIGSIVEYIVSLYGELVYNIKWWDYSDMPLNINGRICVFFSIFWGFLAIYLMSYVNPKIDKLINFVKSKISIGKLKVITTIIIILLFLDCVLTGYALDWFFIRKVHEYDLHVINREKVEEKYEKIYGNEKLSEIIYKFFGDKKMIKTFPNIKTQDIYGNMLYFDSCVGEIKSYYYKFNSEWRGDLVKILKHENRE